MKAKIQEKTSLLEVLAILSPDSSKNTLKGWIEQGRVSIDDVRVSSPRQEVLPGQEVKVGPKASFSEHGIKILYEDRYLVVIDKPDRLLSVASLMENEKTVHAILKRRLKKMVYPVHRLDRDTSGVMLFAYTPEVGDKLKKQFAEHSIERIYFAYVEGRPPQKGTWKSYLTEDDLYFVKSSQTGKLAVTHYEVMEEKDGISLIKFKLETGRKNQIRVHASEAGYPVLGDVKYGGQRRKRLYLHAHILGFQHPILRKQMQFVSPLPSDFVRS
ncbi:MAG TPA: RluA family pseudouridine synthase [Candidatus Babeliaceae bacterium]|nr:RluA family pseudouridine synthase [Candidatus Babeliaceae bacterium]